MDEDATQEIWGRLRAIPAGLHWFCPKQSDDDPEIYDEPAGGEPRQDTEKARRIQEANDRADIVTEALQLLSFDADEASTDKDSPNDWFRSRLDGQLSKCAACIMSFHRRKNSFIERLREDYDEQNVAKFADMLTVLDFKRIRSGLESATEQLAKVPPQQRGPAALDMRSLHALLEALSSDAVLHDQDFMRAYFDEPFDLVQTRRLFRPQDYVPAMGYFLFEDRQARHVWASRSWAKMGRVPMAQEFAWAVQKPLLAAMRRAIAVDLGHDYLARFWLGVKLIVDNLDKELITHSLRALDIDIYRLGLDHLQVDFPPFTDVLQTFAVLLVKSPKDFWDAMGAISPSALIEMVCQNPQYTKLMAQVKDTDEKGSSPLDQLLSWVDPFMASLELGSQPAACRAFAAQFMERLQTENLTEHARMSCFGKGLEVLGRVLQRFIDDKTSVNGSVARLVVIEVMEVIGKHIGSIVAVANLPSTDRYAHAFGSLGLYVIRYALTLDCQCLRVDYDTLDGGAHLQHTEGTGNFTKAIWNEVASKLGRNQVPLAKNALIGFRDLVGLEKLTQNHATSNLEDRKRFNEAYGQVSEKVCQIFERLSDFDPEKLGPLYQKPETASSLIAGLIAPEQANYDAAVDVTKILSSQSGRREAISHLLETYFSTTLSCLAWTIRRISHKATFASNPRMLKTSGDVLQILCNAHDGILRTKTLATKDESNGLGSFWQYQWKALAVIFTMTEGWSGLHDKNVMKEFCRDTMQFAEKLFDCYSIFASAMDSASTNDKAVELPQAKPVGDSQKLLEYPTATMSAMVKWLRLRDEFLATTSVSLICKILRRLGDRGMKVAEEPLLFVDDIAIRGTVKTALKPHEKAELASALEQYHGRSQSPAAADLDESSERTPDAPIGVQSPSTTTQRSEASFGQNAKHRAGVIDLDQWRSKSKLQTPGTDRQSVKGSAKDDIVAASGSLEKYRALQKQREAAHPAMRAVQKPKLASSASSAAAQTAFREKRERERKEKAARDQAQIALLKKGAARPTEGGSGLNGIGIKGKDHAPQKSDMMVSSDSSAEEDDELDAELFGITKSDKPSHQARDNQESQLRAKRLPEMRGPVKKIKQIRNMKDMRARLAPNLSPLHQDILSWDFFHDGEFPPNSDRASYVMVTNTFKTPDQYQATFKALHSLEAWQGLLKAKEETSLKPFEIKIANRTTVDSFIELGTSISMADGKALGLGEADIILMSKAASPMTASSEPHCLARIWKINRKKDAMEITYRVVPSNPLTSVMNPQSVLHGVRVTSITPLEREYGALLGLQYYDLCDEILMAKPSPLLPYKDQTIAPLITNYNVNLAQGKAIQSAIDNDAFTLIQGPPGSGKTKTIVAIVGALLTNSLGDQGVAIARPGAPSTSRPVTAPRKLLVCAPSNAAVDELVMRFKEGVRTLRGQSQKINIVRLGRSDAINSNVIDVTLEELVSAKLNLANPKKNNTGEEIHKLVEETRALTESLNGLRKKLDEARSKGESAEGTQRQFEIDKRRKTTIGAKIDELRDSGNVVAREAEISRRRVQQEILDSAHIICATLSGSGHDMFQNLSIEFETVIIDEAAQSVELSALIPLKYGCSKCILVGDPKQLPPTVLSREAARFQYEQSLFVRMQANHPSDVHLLDTQYRMHPSISRFPSQAFYDGRLLDGDGMAQLRKKPWHQSTILGPYRFFDVQGQQQRGAQGHSLINVAELNVALQLFERLTSDYRTLDFKGKIGIITPYRSQLRELRARFSRRFGEGILDVVEFNTTDAFQGRESEIIIFSCVRAAPNRRIGFLDDIRRMNVGLTRAKSSLWVLGNAPSLIQNEYWGKLIADAKENGCYTGGDLAGLLRQPTVDPDVEMKMDPDSTASSRRPSSGGVSTNEDVEMTDVTNIANGNGTASGARTSKEPVRISPGAPHHLPSGGRSGLDASRYCQSCGSSAHQTRECDHPEARRVMTGKCYRCGSLDHPLAKCAADRCTECGAFGHVRRNCTSRSTLSREEQAHIMRSEGKFHGQKQAAVESQIKRQLGSHDPQIPVIQPTRKTPPLDQRGVPAKGSSHAAAAEHKRKREASPPNVVAPLKPATGLADLPSRPAGPLPPVGGSINGGRPPQGPSQAGQSPGPAGSGGGVRRGPHPPRKKKKEVDPFIRPNRKSRPG